MLDSDSLQVESYNGIKNKNNLLDFDILNNTNEKNNEESQTTIKLNKNKELENNISQFEPKPTIEFSS